MALPPEQTGIVTLESQDLQFVNELALPQFKVISSQLLSKHNNSVAEVEIKLKRIFSSHITNTYMPTCTLLILAQATLHFDEARLELAIGLLLTVLLVMYTLYQGICISLTPTAYLKMIDYWLFFCLLMPFFSFMIEMHWLLQKTKCNLSETSKQWVTDEKEAEKDSKRHKKAFRYCAHGITATFFITYFLIALLMYNEFI